MNDSQITKINRFWEMRVIFFDELTNSSGNNIAFWNKPLSELTKQEEEQVWHFMASKKLRFKLNTVKGYKILQKHIELIKSEFSILEIDDYELTYALIAELHYVKNYLLPRAMM